MNVQRSTCPDIIKAIMKGIVLFLLFSLILSRYNAKEDYTKTDGLSESTINIVTHENY